MQTLPLYKKKKKMNVQSLASTISFLSVHLSLYERQRGREGVDLSSFHANQTLVQFRWVLVTRGSVIVISTSTQTQMDVL